MTTHRPKKGHAGWYPDPNSEGWERYWSGKSWTNREREVGGQELDGEDLVQEPVSQVRRGKPQPGIPGWYIDPSDEDLARFWNGRDWTSEERPTSEIGYDAVDSSSGSGDNLIVVSAALAIASVGAALLLPRFLAGLGAVVGLVALGLSIPRIFSDKSPEKARGDGRLVFIAFIAAIGVVLAIIAVAQVNDAVNDL